MTELPENVTTALAKENFDVLSFVSGQGTPVDKVVIYTDNEAGYRLAEIAELEASIANRAEHEGLGIADEFDYIDQDEVDELVERVNSTALTFKLRGLAPAAKKAIRASLVAKHNFKEGTDPEEAEGFYSEYSYTLTSKTLVSVTRGDGAVDDTAWTTERVEKLREVLNESEYARLDQAVFAINFETDIFDRAASADFLSKR